jgi:hypothetical protein
MHEYRSKEAAALAKLDSAKIIEHMKQYVAKEVDSLVQEKVEAQMAEFNRQQMHAQQEFLNRPSGEQQLALSLTRLAQVNNQSQVDVGNLAILVKAVSVSVLLFFKNYLIFQYFGLSLSTVWAC